MAQRLRALAVLAEESSSIPSTHTRPLKTAAVDTLLPQAKRPSESALNSNFPLRAGWGLGSAL